jgi:hypothetical protein
MDLFHKIMALVDKNSGNIPEGDYLQLCNTIQELREHVKPPSFLDQSIPMWGYDETNQRPPVFQPTHVVPITDGQPHEWMDDSLPSDPDTAAQRDREQFHQQWRERSGDEEVMYPGLHEFLQQLDEEWSDPVEPGAYYPPPRQTMQEAVMMDVD